MELDVANLELLSLNPEQSDQHKAIGGKIYSIFQREFIATTWHSSISMMLEAVHTGTNTIYTANNAFDFLRHTYMRVHLPTIIVKPEYKDKVLIAWSHNPGSNVNTLATLNSDENHFQSWDNHWYDINSQFFEFSGEGKRQSRNVGVGNCPYLVGWHAKLPSYTANVHQPWYYCNDPALAFPLLYNNSQTRTRHVYFQRRNCTDLLRMQILENGEWKKVLPQNMSTYLISCPVIPPPELWGRYVLLSKVERDYIKSCKDSTVTIYYNDIVRCDGKNSCNNGMIETVSLACRNPCLAMFWMAKNMTAEHYNSHSNYSTDADNIIDGWDPIDHNTYTYNENLYRFHNMASDHFNIAESRFSFPSAPCEPGYHGLAFADDCTNFHGEVGLVLNGLVCALSCMINDGADRELESINSPGNNKYHLIIRLLVRRKMIINRTGSPDNPQFKITVR